MRARDVAGRLEKACEFCIRDRGLVDAETFERDVCAGCWKWRRNDGPVFAPLGGRIGSAHSRIRIVISGRGAPRESRSCLLAAMAQPSPMRR